MVDIKRTVDDSLGAGDGGGNEPPESGPLTKEECDDLHPRAAVALAVRCSLRVLPVVGPPPLVNNREGRAIVTDLEAALFSMARWARGDSVKNEVLSAAGKATFSAVRAASDAAIFARSGVDVSVGARAATAADVAAFADRSVSAAVANRAFEATHAAHAATIASAHATVAATQFAGQANANAAAHADYNLLRDKAPNGEIDGIAMVLSKALWPSGMPKGWKSEVLDPWKKATADDKEQAATAWRHMRMVDSENEIIAVKSEGLTKNWYDREKLEDQERLDQEHMEQVQREDREKQEYKDRELERRERELERLERGHLERLQKEKEAPPENQEEEISPEGGFSELTTVVRTGSTTAQAEHPGEKDLLGRGHLVSALAAMFADEGQGTPITMGLFGDWGEGKSTVMRLLKKQLMQDHPGQFAFATFNAWQYEQTNNPAAGMAQEVVSGLTHGVSDAERARLHAGFAWNEHREGLIKVLISVIGLAITAVAAIVSFVTGQETEGAVFSIIAGGAFVYIARFWKLLEHPLVAELQSYMKLPQYGKHLGLIPVLKHHIRTLCGLRLRKGFVAVPEDALDPIRPPDEPPSRLVRLSSGLLGLNRFFNRTLGGPKKTKEGASERPERLVVFVDDLDRCQPQGIVKTFEAVRLVMDLPETIVIVAVDQRIALSAVGLHFSKMGGDHRAPEDIARDYLGKVVQLPICLTRPDEHEVQGYIDGELFKDLREEEPPQKEDVVSTPESDITKEDIQPEGPPEDTGSDSLADKGGLEEEDKHTHDELPDETKLDRVEEPTEAQMRETKSERERFTQQANKLGFTNPRQLLRLRNCYRMLKLLNRKESDWGRLMDMLFWQEFLHQWPLSTHRQCEEAVRQKEPYDTILREDVREYAKQAGSTLRKTLGQGEHYDELAESVRRFVLPRNEGTPIPDEPSPK